MRQALSGEIGWRWDSNWERIYMDMHGKGLDRFCQNCMMCDLCGSELQYAGHRWAVDNSLILTTTHGTPKMPSRHSRYLWNRCSYCHLCTEPAVLLICWHVLQSTYKFKPMHMLWSCLALVTSPFVCYHF